MIMFAEGWSRHRICRKIGSLRSVKSEIFIEPIQIIIQLSSVRGETLTEVHIAPLTELSWIGNNEVYKYLVPNGTKQMFLWLSHLMCGKAPPFRDDCSIHSE